MDCKRIPIPGSKVRIHELLFGVKKFLNIEDCSSLILIGDFNVDLALHNEPLELLIALIKQLNLKIDTNNIPTRGEAILHFEIVSTNLPI